MVIFYVASTSSFVLLRCFTTTLLGNVREKNPYNLQQNIMRTIGAAPWGDKDVTLMGQRRKPPSIVPGGTLNSVEKAESNMFNMKDARNSIQ